MCRSRETGHSKKGRPANGAYCLAVRQVVYDSGIRAARSDPMKPPANAMSGYAVTAIPVTAPEFRLAYLVNEYPKVSHTFIRREIVELERRGHSIFRVSIRPPGSFVDPADIEEAKKTYVCLSEPALVMAWRTLAAAMGRPARFARALRMAMGMGRVSHRGMPRFLAYLAEAATLLPVFKRNRIDHVHVHFGTNGVDVARLLKAIGGPTYSFTIHGPDEWDAPIGFSIGAKARDAEFVVAITRYCMSQLRRWVDYTDWGNIHIVHCSVGNHFLAPARPIDAESETFLCVGRISAQKGHLVLIDAFAKFRAAVGRGRLVLAGDGELRAVVEERIRAHGLGDCVSITGWVGEAEIRRLLEDCRALVLPSFAEGLPVVIMEALALERPVITTAITGIPELVKHRENGWLVAPSDEDALAAAMCEALDAPVERLRAMGRAGRERVLAEYATATEAAKLDCLFREAVAARRGR